MNMFFPRKSIQATLIPCETCSSMPDSNGVEDCNQLFSQGFSCKLGRKVSSKEDIISASYEIFLSTEHARILEKR